MLVRKLWRTRSDHGGSWNVIDGVPEARPRWRITGSEIEDVQIIIIAKGREEQPVPRLRSLMDSGGRR